MNSEELGKRFLDASIKVMGRNRTLLFSINIIAALVLVVVYLEQMSFDEDQRKGHLIAYKDACGTLNKNVSSFVDNAEKDVIKKCYDISQMTGIIISKENIPERLIQDISNDLYRINRIQNEMKSVKLDSAVVAPLGFGLPVPRNDLTIICGVILVLLYSWLAFSFNQHARIIKEITSEFGNQVKKGNGSPSNLKNFNRLIEVNFMFQTSKKNIASYFVKLLYLAAPISMTIALVNDLYMPSLKGNYRAYINEVLTFPRILETIIVVILWGISYSIMKSDNDTNEVYDKKHKIKKTANPVDNQSEPPKVSHEDKGLVENK